MEAEEQAEYLIREFGNNAWNEANNYLLDNPDRKEYWTRVLFWINLKTL